MSQSIHKDTPAIQLDVIETVPMDIDMVTANSLYEEIERTGSARVYDILFETGSYEMLPESGRFHQSVQMKRRKGGH
ncbi:MAG: hypothetical protein EA359_14660 [Balneolaceae bacterium]|nr:MAG: hypothetical protein EA359_14660 [Balneolaceae bacterium]